MGAQTVQLDDELTLTRGNVRVAWVNLGEGTSGDHDPDDPSDVNLLRFDVHRLDAGDWEAVDDASYCTRVPAGTSEEVLRDLLELIMRRVYAAVCAGQSIRRECERLSSLDADSSSAQSADSSLCEGREGPLVRVGGESAMPDLCYSIPSPALNGASNGCEALDNLARAIGRLGPPPQAELRVRATDLTICSGAGFAVYTLRSTPTRLGWEQRVLAFPAEALLEGVHRLSSWAERTRRICEHSSSQAALVGRARFDVEVRACRVPVGVVAAEARACEQFFGLHDAEESIYRISLAAASVHLASGKEAAKAGRQMLADVTKARHPSHVPLFPLQRALAEEVALGRSLDALCSRAEEFCSQGEKSPQNQLFRRFGLAGTRDGKKARRYARVVPHPSAVQLCSVVDMAPEEVGL